MGVQPLSISRTFYEIDYVPQKLRSLESCVLACYSMLNSKYSGVAELTIGSQILKDDALRLFQDLAIDAGLISNRLLLNFAEIKLDNGTLVNLKNGVTLSDFGLGPVPVSDATAILPGIPKTELHKIWGLVLTTASKALAHFTDQGATVQVEHLGFGSYATSLLIRKHFYDALGKPQPPQLLRPEVVPCLAGVWLGIEPPIML